MTRVPDSFWLKIDKNGPVPEDRPDLGPCWLWLGYCAKGYGKYAGRGVHRLVYLLLVGEVPDGLQLDHLCRRRNCCNPKHLEPVTGKVNAERGDAGRNEGSRSALDAARQERLAKESCSRGHPFDEKNTYMKKGRRVCRACNALHQRRFHAKEAS